MLARALQQCNVTHRVIQRSVQAIAAEAQKRLHIQQNSTPFNGFKQDANPLGGSPSTPQPSTPNSGNGGNTSSNQQDWTFEEQFKQVTINETIVAR